MILQALTEYYDRKADDLPPFGFEEKEIPFIIVIDENGRFINLENNSEIENGETTVHTLRVPKASGRSGAKSYETAYYLWDHYGYVAAQPKIAKPGDTPSSKAIEDAQKQHTSFKRLTAQLRQKIPADPGIKAVDLFLNSPEEIEKLKTSVNWQECLKIKGCNLSFRLSGEPHLICQSERVINWIKQQPLPEENVKDGYCLVSGEKPRLFACTMQLVASIRNPHLWLPSMSLPTPLLERTRASIFLSALKPLSNTQPRLITCCEKHHRPNSASSIRVMFAGLKNKTLWNKHLH